jgi:hypothetical protein
MSDRDDLLLRDAFDRFADEALPFVRPAGADTTLRVAGQRRRIRAIGVGALATALVIATLTVYANIGRGTTTLPVPPSTQSPTPVPKTDEPTPPAPDDPFAALPPEVAGATLQLDWTWAPASGAGPCTSGAVTFVDGQYVPPTEAPNQGILESDRIDVDRDGDEDYVIHAFCATSEATDRIVAAFARSGSTFTLMGVIVTTEGEVDDVLAVESGPDRTVRVQVADLQPCCTVAPNSAVRQWRTYRWSASIFQQVQGSTTFVADATQARVTATVPVVKLGALRNGSYPATVRITVRNAGPRTASAVTVVAEMAIRPGAGGDWDSCEMPDPITNDVPICTVGDLRAGQSVTLVLPGTVDAAYGTPAFEGVQFGQVQVRAGETRYPADVEVKLMFP